MSRKKYEFTSFRCLAEAIRDELLVGNAVLDGEIVALDKNGRSQFRQLMFRRCQPHLYVFDLLWCDGEDLRSLPLEERKRRLRQVVPKDGDRLLFCDHLERDGETLFHLAQEHDLEGVVAKHRAGRYEPEVASTWLKVRNRNYSQWDGRAALFEKERHRKPAG